MFSPAQLFCEEVGWVDCVNSHQGRWAKEAVGDLHTAGAKGWGRGLLQVPCAEVPSESPGGLMEAVLLRGTALLDHEITGEPPSRLRSRQTWGWR